MGTLFSKIQIAGGAAMALAALAGIAPAHELQCAPRQQIIEKLAHDYNEKAVAMGLSAAGSLVVIYASPSGTWTTTIVTPQGAECVVDVGDGWTEVAPRSDTTGQAQSPRRNEMTAQR